MLFNSQNPALTERLSNLENHLQDEHPDLLKVLPTYRQMDKVLYRMGLLSNDQSLATRITWWPLISVLGTFSSGKSTFINSVINEGLQKTGNQAVDDKFTVVCFSHHETSRTLPGTALNNDPRFPFFRIGAEIEKVSTGEGRRIDTYLQLKTSSAGALKGRTMIDSPGFDADDQRSSTLRLTDHIIDISDLVLIFFDARHPEPGAMQDTLQHLVAKASGRADSNKFLYILNQIDTTAKEDNPEEVVAAWQRALAQTGLTAGRFLCIYNEDAAVPIEDDALRARYQRKRDADVAEIEQRMNEVEVERGYRIISSLEDAARRIESDVIPKLQGALSSWRKLTAVGDVVGLGLVAGLVYAIQALFGDQVLINAYTAINGYVIGMLAAAGGLGVLALLWHYVMRHLAGNIVAKRLPESFGDHELDLRSAFRKSTRAWRSIFGSDPAGWGGKTRTMLKDVLNTIESHIQRLNDLHTDPSGRKRAPAAVEPAMIAEVVDAMPLEEAPLEETPQPETKMAPASATAE